MPISIIVCDAVLNPVIFELEFAVQRDGTSEHLWGLHGNRLVGPAVALLYICIVVGWLNGAWCGAVSE